MSDYDSEEDVKDIIDNDDIESGDDLKS